MDIYDIKLDEITDKYIEYLDKIQESNLEIASEFVNMASKLLYLKSKKLLPQIEEEKEEEISEEELINRIIEYKQYKDASQKLKENFEENSLRFFKQPENVDFSKKEIDDNYEKGIIPLLYEKILTKNKDKKNEQAKNIEKIAITDTYTVIGKVKEMFKVLIRQKKFIFNKLFSIKEHNKQEVVTAFSGLLELSKREKVRTNQEELFGDIDVTRKN